MTPVSQTKFVTTHGTGDCFNACVASLFDMRLEDVPDISPTGRGVWFINWKKWFKEAKQLALDITPSDKPPVGYTIVSVETDRSYPEGHSKAGEPISHAVIALDGEIVFDPYPGYTGEYKINYFYIFYPQSEADEF